MSNNCPHCNKSVEEFIQTGILGCPYCYGVFKKEIAEYIKNAQGSFIHVGKKPLSYGDNKILVEEYQQLLQKKQNAIINKNFDEASLLEDRIQRLAEILSERGLK